MPEEDIKPLNENNQVTIPNETQSEGSLDEPIDKNLKNMEVHYHPKLHHRRKKTSEYIIEFILIFFAVTLGFIAEQFREELSEKSKAKEYAKGLINDLIKDTISLNETLKFWKQVYIYEDSLVWLINNHNFKNPPRGTFYLYSRFAASGTPPHMNTAALDQIKNSGSIRFLESSLAIRLSEYEAQWRFFDINYADILDMRTEIREIRKQVLLNKYFDPFNRIFIFEKSPVTDSLVRINLPLADVNPGLLNKYANSISVLRLNIANIVDKEYLKTISLAKELISELKKDYNID